MNTEENKSPNFEYDSEKRKNIKKTLNSQFSTFNSCDDNLVFVPDEHIQVIERVLNNWEQMKQQFHRK